MAGTPRCGIFRSGPAPSSLNLGVETILALRSWMVSALSPYPRETGLWAPVRLVESLFGLGAMPRCRQIDISVR